MRNYGEENGVPEKIRIKNEQFIAYKMKAVKRYVAVAKSCRPAALHAALSEIFEITDEPEPVWKDINAEEARKALKIEGGEQ